MECILKGTQETIAILGGEESGGWARGGACQEEEDTSFAYRLRLKIKIRVYS